jgi:hypothetical protein
MWKATDEERSQWAEYTRVLEKKALAHAHEAGDRDRRS